MDNTKKVDILRVRGDKASKEEDIVILEYPFTIFINDKEIITLLCSPSSLEDLAVGFLYSEGYINSLSDIKSINIDEKRGIGYIDIDETITSGCGKGTTFYDVVDSSEFRKIEEPFPIKINYIKKLVKEFNKKSELFINTGGVHSCALCSASNIIIFEEDIGRHNALDKVFGRVLFEEIDTKDKMILTSGRISSEMLIKIAKRQVPVIVSRSAPTSLSVEMAKKLNITLIGFARGEKMNIYSSFHT